MGDHYTFAYEAPLHEVFPGLHDAQASWLSALDSLPAPDRRTHELVRMVCLVIAGSEGGVERHAALAAEVGATWSDVLGSIMLTVPSHGLARAVSAMPAARRGFETGLAAAAADADADEAGDPTDG